MHAHLVAAVVVAWSTVAVAEGDEPPPEPAVERPAAAAAEATTVGGAPIGSSARGAAMDWMVMPTGYDVGGTLRYVTSPAGALSDRPLRFTDLAFLDLHARLALGGRVELALATTLVPKQPSDADEPVWQGTGVGLRWQPSSSSAYALGATGAAGPMLDQLGRWIQSGLSISSRKRLVGDATGGIQFEGSLGGDGTFLVPHAGDVTSLAEARLDLGVLFHVGKRGSDGGGGAMWLSSSYALPVWHRGKDPVSMSELDPQSRLDFTLGVMGTLLDTWDLIIELRVTDRGDLDYPATRLPILDGGFDLFQLGFGVTYHGRYPRKDPDERGPLIQIP